MSWIPGAFTDANLAPACTVTGGLTASGLGLQNMLEDERYLMAPTRFLTPSNPANTRFVVMPPRAVGVSMISLLFHTFSIGARYRLTVADPAGSLASPVYDSGLQLVNGRVYGPGELPWEHSGAWFGQLSTDELNLWPRHLFMLLPTTVTDAISVELFDEENPEPFIDIGGLHIASGFSPEINFDRGRELTLLPRDLLDEGPSGRIFSERRVGRRQLTASYSNLADAETRRFFDASARAGVSGTVIFVPNGADEAARLREAFPANFAKPPGAKFTYERANSTALILSEILG